MQAVTIDRYGDPGELGIAGVPDPKVWPDSALVRVHAAGVNPVDWKIRRGYLDAAFPTVFPAVLGWDVAGVVEQAGPGLPEFTPGDEVVGYVRKDWVQDGTYAELVTAPVRSLAAKPTSASWEEAATLPLAGLTAYQALTRPLRVTVDDVLLVHAAAGGVGSLAVQLGRVMGARVIGTASERNHDFLRDLGAEPVSYGEGLVDRVRSLAPDGVTAILDLVGGEALELTPYLLKPEGRMVSVIDPVRSADLGGHYLFVRPAPIDLAALVRYVEDGDLRLPDVQALPLDRAGDAHRLLEEGHVRGKIALTP